MDRVVGHRVPDADLDQMSNVPVRYHAAGLKAFPALARHDPFDRMLLSQARCDDLLLLTSDQLLLDLDLT